MRLLFLESIHGVYEELKYASCVAHKFAEEIRKEGHEVIEVRDPTPEEGNEAIKKYNPDIVWWVGHGSPTKATLSRLKIWITTTYNLRQIVNRIAVAHACYTGLKLGKVAISKRTKAYLGYTKELWFQWCNDPEYYNCACSGKNPYGVNPELWKKILESSHVGSLTFVKELAEGKNYKTAFNDSIKAFDKYEEEFKSIKPSNPGEAAILKVQIWALENNKSAQVLYVSKSNNNVQELSKIRVEKSGVTISAVILLILMILSWIINAFKSKKKEL